MTTETSLTTAAASSSTSSEAHLDYLSQGPFSDPRDLSARLTAIAERVGPDPRALAEALRGLMVHVFWRHAYGLEDEPGRARAETNLRDVRAALARIGELEVACGRREDDVSPLPIASRLIGNCRDHALLHAALLRAAGIPARARCGFARYFVANHWEDHWVVERWDGRRWRLGDPQLDALMIEKLGVRFDPMDLPVGEFISGGEAWLACRRGDDPDRYGIFHFHGWDFVKGDLIRDVAALAKRELLPWDCWGLMMKAHRDLAAHELELLDAVAGATPMRAPGRLDRFAELAGRPGLRLPRRITSYVSGGEPVQVDLGPILDR